MSLRSVHVEVVTSLSLKDFLLAFSRFNDVRGKVEIIFSDNGSSFQAASKALPDLLKSRELRNSLREKGIRWEFIPPYAPAQGGSCDIHRLEQYLIKKNGKTMHRLIIVKLINNQDKNRIFRSAKNLKTFNETRRSCNEYSPYVYVTEHLPAKFQEQRKLLMSEFKEAKRNNQSAYWRAFDGSYCLFVDGVAINLPKKTSKKR